MTFLIIKSSPKMLIIYSQSEVFPCKAFFPYPSFNSMLNSFYSLPPFYQTFVYFFQFTPAYQLIIFSHFLYFFILSLIYYYTLSCIVYIIIPKTLKINRHPSFFPPSLKLINKLSFQLKILLLTIKYTHQVICSHHQFIINITTLDN